MTLPQAVRHVRARAAAGRPLHVAGVRREAPHLLAFALSRRPYLGWRGLLRAAGVEPRRPALEGQVPCRLCGRSYRILGRHLPARHDMTGEEYVREFPGAELCCEELRAAKLGKGTPFPHWEPFWSPEYALDRLWEHRRRGRRLNFYQVLGVDPTLAAYVLVAFGSWDAALRRLGLEPRAVRLQKEGISFTRWQVVAALRARVDRHLPVHDAALEESDLPLLNAARRRFGSLPNAQEAAGVPRHLRRRRRDRYQDREAEVIKAAARKVALLSGRKRLAAARAFHERHHRAYTQIFTSLNRLAAAAGVDPAKLCRFRFPNAAFVAEEGRRLRAAGEELRPGAVFQRDRTLYRAISQHFPSFDRFLQAVA